MQKKICTSGGCNSKLDPTILDKILAKIKKKEDENLIVGFDSKDDAAVYKLSEDLAIVQTLDFFNKIVHQNDSFGKIAAANALSDIYAMGAVPKIALSIACFDEKENYENFSEIIEGAACKVLEAGATLCGGHTLNDDEVKFGLSVTGIINPNKILHNNRCKIGDKIILTKPLGVGIITTAYKLDEGNQESYMQAVKQMETLNKYASEIMLKYDVSACTDVTGFGFLGHLSEMLNNNYSFLIDSKNIPYIEDARKFANKLITTSAAQKNKNYLKNKINFCGVDDDLQEILFDPQTSGGLLISINNDQSKELLEELCTLEIKSHIVGQVCEKMEYDIIVQ